MQIYIQNKICEFHRAIFSSFYNISQPNFAILLILSYGNGPTVPYLKNLFILVIILCTEDSF